MKIKIKKLVILGAGKLLFTVYSKTDWKRLNIQVKQIFLSDVNIREDKIKCVKRDKKTTTKKVSRCLFSSILEWLTSVKI